MINDEKHVPVLCCWFFVFTVQVPKKENRTFVPVPLHLFQEWNWDNSSSVPEKGPGLLIDG